MDAASGVEILDEAFCISHNGSTLGKGINPTVLPPAMGKIVGQAMLFSLGMATR